MKRDEVILLSDHGQLLGYLVVYGPGFNEGCIEAFDTQGNIVGSYTSKARAAAAIAARAGLWSTYNH